MNPEFYRRHFFRLLVFFRWISLLPPLLVVQSSGNTSPMVPQTLVFLVAIVVNFAITLNLRWLNQLLTRQPLLLTLDLIYSVSLLIVSGGVDSPYFLHGFNPLLAAAFFFQVRGGITASMVFTLFYLGGISISNSPPYFEQAPVPFLMQFVGIWILPAAVGSISQISKNLIETNQALTNTKMELSAQNKDLQQNHQRLRTIHDLTLLLQVAPDVKTMQQQVLTTLANSLSYPQALLALVKPGTQVTQSWKGLKDGVFDEAPKDVEIERLDQENPKYNLLGEVMSSHKPRVVSKDSYDLLPDGIANWLGGQTGLFTPLVFHEQVVGLLIIPVENENIILDIDQYTLIKTLANQAATSLGTTMLCVERAQDLAVEQERNRIAREIHDTVSQSLFGMIYSMDACIRMLPESGESVKKELIELQSLANLTRDQVRHSIFDLWPSSLTLDIFKSDLDHYVSHCFRLKPFEIEYDVEGDFDSLSPALRRNLYRITQEALTNALHHAGVDRAVVDMDIDDHEVALSVQDEGVGFDVANALSREYSREHFGLHGIQERTQALGGASDIISKPGTGSKINVRIPLGNNRRKLRG